MLIRTLLALVDGKDGSEAVLHTGFAVARQFDAHIVVLHVRPDPSEALRGVEIGGATWPMASDVVKAAKQTAEETASKLCAMFDDYVARNEVPIAQAPTARSAFSAEFCERSGRENIVLALLSRRTDFIVVNRLSEQARSSLSLLGALTDTGQPALVAPSEPVESLGRNIAIAWDGSVEAARAVEAALPFLSGADEIVVLTTPEGATAMANPEDVVEHLAWHDIAASVRVYEAEPQTVGQQLLAEVGKIGADLLVIGGYSRTPVDVMHLGAVTHHVIAESNLPIFIGN